VTTEEHQLERDIAAVCRVLVDPEISREVRLTASETMRQMIALRTPERIAEMEREKGLCV
jgi:hypothetical protein